jgi:hypothetical protein
VGNARLSPQLRRMSILHPFHSSRRPEPLKDTDCDHEILLLDHSLTGTTVRSRSYSPSRNERRNSPPPGKLLTRRHSDDHLSKRQSLRAGLAKLKYGKYQDRPEQCLDDGETYLGGGPGPCTEAARNARGEESRPKSSESLKPHKRRLEDRESVIDILYENQRGCFLCGMPLFSARALGALDPSPWTNAAQKPSATDITNAQVPDPSWQWAWEEWKINYSDEVDEDGWQYSFMSSKKFSWHKPRWWNSFVRRRAWIRRRVRKSQEDLMQDARRFSSDYFTILPSNVQSRSPSKAGSVHKGRTSIGQLEANDVVNRENIHDIGHLMDVLKRSRIDRERTETVENFIRNRGDDLYYLKDRMHEIMSQFIFQASRRLLLTHLLSLYDEAFKRRDERVRNGMEEDPAETKKIANLEAAIKAADEEVKRLEYWSDIKGMAEKGKNKSAVDQSQGWNKGKWTSIDDNGPKDVIFDRGTQEAEVSAMAHGAEIAGAVPVDKGKGRA